MNGDGVTTKVVKGRKLEIASPDGTVTTFHVQGVTECEALDRVMKELAGLADHVRTLDAAVRAARSMRMAIQTGEGHATAYSNLARELDALDKGSGPAPRTEVPFAAMLALDRLFHYAYSIAPDRGLARADRDLVERALETEIKKALGIT